MSAMGYAFCMGMSWALCAAMGECRLMAMCTRVVSMSVRSSGIFPIDDTVIRFGLHASPHSAVSISMVWSMAGRLSSGSPMPMNTMLVRCVDSFTESIWFMICAGVSCPWNPCRPVMQNLHAILHPACELTHSVARSRSGIITVSMSRPGVPGNRYLTVPSVLVVNVRGCWRPRV